MNYRRLLRRIARRLPPPVPDEIIVRWVDTATVAPVRNTTQPGPSHSVPPTQPPHRAKPPAPKALQ